MNVSETQANLSPLERFLIHEADALLAQGEDLTVYRLTTEAYFGMLTHFVALVENMSTARLIDPEAANHIQRIVGPVYDRHLELRDEILPPEDLT